MIETFAAATYSTRPDTRASTAASSDSAVKSSRALVASIVYLFKQTRASRIVQQQWGTQREWDQPVKTRVAHKIGKRMDRYCPALAQAHYYSPKLVACGNQCLHAHDRVIEHHGDHLGRKSRAGKTSLARTCVCTLSENNREHDWMGKKQAMGLIPYTTLPASCPR